MSLRLHIRVLSEVTLNKKIDWPTHSYKCCNHRSGNTLERMQHDTGSTHNLSCLVWIGFVMFGEINQVQNCNWLKSQTCILRLHLIFWNHRPVFLCICIFWSNFQVIFVFHCVQKIFGNPFCEISEDDQTHFGQDEATEIPNLGPNWHIKVKIWNSLSVCLCVCILIVFLILIVFHLYSVPLKEENNWRTRMTLSVAFSELVRGGVALVRLG